MDGYHKGASSLRPDIDGASTGVVELLMLLVELLDALGEERFLFAAEE